MNQIKGHGIQLTFRALITVIAVFIFGWTLRFTVFNQDISMSTSRDISEDVNWIPDRFVFPESNDSDEEGLIPSFTNASMTKGKSSDTPSTILAAGDIAKCDSEDPWREKFLKLLKILPDDGPQEPFLENLLELLFLSEETNYPANATLTAHLVHRVPGRVLALGDLVYPTGSTQQFQECYESTWGHFKERTYRVPGNHEYMQKDAAPYFTYWGSQAGEIGRGYYSFDVSGWHIIALNSKIEKEKYEGTISAQHAWLQEDWAATKADCILAYWHHPVFSSGQHPGTPRMKNILRTLYNVGVTVVLTGHAHDYERFALQNPEGVRDRYHGFRQFVVGTGGVPLRPLGKRHKNSEAFRADSYGVLRLDLYSNYYAWKFLPVNEDHPYDTGTGTCVTPSRPKALLQQT